MATGVLFLCVANSARSQMAEGFARAVAPPGISVFSAGSAPGRLNPFAVRAMREVGIDIARHYSKSIDDIPTAEIGTAVTLCAEEVCPLFAGDVRRLHRPVPDPAATTGGDEDIIAAFRRARDQIRDLVAELFPD